MKFLMKDFYSELNAHSFKGLTAEELYSVTLSD